MERFEIVGLRALALTLGLASLAGCGAANLLPSDPIPAPLSATRVNLVFVVSEDLSYSADPDMNLNTANLTNEGLQRALQMGRFLKQSVLGGNNVTAIYALKPMTHLQTANDLPDMVPLETVQQFAMLNQIRVAYQGNPGPAANSFTIFSSYAQGAVPSGVATPVVPCLGCQGLDFGDLDGDNESLVGGVIAAGNPGYYIFSAPWETVSTLMAKVNQSEGYNLTLPAGYAGPNIVYAVSIASGGASLTTYHSDLTPVSTYPAMPPVQNFSAPCTAPYFHIPVTGGGGGAIIPNGINTNETVYLIRHAEAHPVPNWDDGNYIAAGQWRALLLPQALQNKIHPTAVYSIDTAVGMPSSLVDGVITSSYVRPALTVEPYAIAKNLPYNLAASVPYLAQSPPQLCTDTSNVLFTGGALSNQTVLVAWEHKHIPCIVNALLASYHSNQTAPDWVSSNDYDTIWTVSIDSQSNLSVDNGMCEGINSNLLPAMAPQF